MQVLIDDPFYSTLFLFVACILLFLEVFVPSGGILGILAVSFGVLSVWGFWVQDHAVIACAAAGTLVAFGIATLWWVITKVKLKSVLSPETSTSVDTRLDAQLVGHEGSTLTPLRPAGMALIDGKKVDVVSRGAFIDKDARIRVVELSGNRVVVRSIEEGRSEA